MQEKNVRKVPPDHCLVFTGQWSGALKLPGVKDIKYTKDYKNQIKLSEDIGSILIGTLLGDASAEKQHVNTRIKYKQGEIHKDYLIHLYEKLEKFVSNPPKEKKNHHKVYDKIYTSWNFQTLSMPCFNYYYNIFYPNKKKIIPSNIGELLTGQALAY